MFTDPIFERHRQEVWPFFWPVFVMAIPAVQPAGRGAPGRGLPLHRPIRSARSASIRITDTVFPGAPASWKDSLFFATGAYGSAARFTSPVFPGWPRDLQQQSADPEIQDPTAECTDPALIQIARITLLNHVPSDAGPSARPMPR